jgi:hypothetical protein
LQEGNHQIAIDPPDITLTWQYSRVSSPEQIPDYYLFHDPVTPNGLEAAFYANGNWEGTPVAKRIYPFVSQYIHVVPMNRPYSVRYSGYLYAPETGDYQLGVQAIDTAALDIDRENVIPTSAPDQLAQTAITLEQGWHMIEVRHQDLTSATRIYLTWIPPGESAFTPIGRDYLCPTADLCVAPRSSQGNE